MIRCSMVSSDEPASSSSRTRSINAPSARPIDTSMILTARDKANLWSRKVEAPDLWSAPHEPARGPRLDTQARPAPPHGHGRQHAAGDQRAGPEPDGNVRLLDASEPRAFGCDLDEPDRLSLEVAGAAVVQAPGKLDPRDRHDRAAVRLDRLAVAELASLEPGEDLVQPRRI